MVVVVAFCGIPSLSSSTSSPIEFQALVMIARFSDTDVDDDTDIDNAVNDDIDFDFVFIVLVLVLVVLLLLPTVCCDDKTSRGSVTNVLSIAAIAARSNRVEGRSGGSESGCTPPFLLLLILLLPLNLILLLLL